MTNPDKHFSKFALLTKKAEEILIKNTWEDRYTVPSPNLYPYQWNWDSGFVAMGFAHFDLLRAIKEIESLFEGQWKNGMLPHIIFHNKKREGYFPGPGYWQSSQFRHATQAVETSGISQPPVHGFVLEKLFQMHSDDERLHHFIHFIYPKIVRLHQYYYEECDPNKEGLAFIYHPWASGRDNSPLWDDLIKNIPVKKQDIPAYQRYDNLKADPSERPSDLDYDIYVYLMELGKKHEYNGLQIAEVSPFLVQDTLFNAMLIRSNEALIELGAFFGFDTGKIQEWQQQSKNTFNQKLWVDHLQTYAPYDLRNNKHISLKEIGAYTALYAGIPNQTRADLLIDQMDALADRKEGYRIMPSFDVDHWIFDPKKYWKGPIWPQMNWLLFQGAKRYGHHGTARQLQMDFLELVEKLGFYEYFDPRKAEVEKLSHGYGGNDFSWTAAVVLDLILNE